MAAFCDAIGSLLWHVLPALVGVGLGGFLVNRFFVRKANLAALVERICDSLTELRIDCAAYWSVNVPTDEDGLSKHAVLEAKIKGHTIYVSALVAVVEEKYQKLPLNERTCVMDLLDAATGGDFETRHRKADKHRYTRVVRCANRLNATLQRLKV